MRWIPTRVHGYLDYATGVILLFAPWIFGFVGDNPQTWVPMLLGLGIILYSLLTNYELGAWRNLSMRTHLAFDFLGGLLLALSPWIFGFARDVFVPHLIVGIFEIGSALFTKREASNERALHNFNRTAPSH